MRSKKEFGEGRTYTPREIARHVSERTCAPFETVWPIVQQFICVVHNLLDDGQTVWLKGIGKIYWKPTRRSRGVKLKLQPTLTLRKGRPIMEKYGVELDDKTKEASSGKRPTECPLCGSKLDSGSACPVHGTEPLEKKRDE